MAKYIVQFDWTESNLLRRVLVDQRKALKDKLFFAKYPEVDYLEQDIKQIDKLIDKLNEAL